MADTQTCLSTVIGSPHVPARAMSLPYRPASGLSHVASVLLAVLHGLSAVSALPRSRRGQLQLCARL